MTHWVDLDGHTVQTLQLLNKHDIKTDFEGYSTYEPAIYAAVRAGRPRVLSKLLGLGVNIHSQAGEHGNLLHTTVAVAQHKRPGQHAECVEILLNQGTNPNISGKVHPTALGAALAAPWSYEDTTTPLLKRELVFGDHRSALLEKSVALHACHVTQHLLQARIGIAEAELQAKLLVSASHPSDPIPMFIIFAKAGLDIKACGAAALHKVTYEGAPSPLTWLLKHGVDANAAGDKYASAVITCVAASFGSSDTVEIIKVLIEHGADMKLHGPAALELAVANLYDEEVLILLRESATSNGA
jgi:hypothetical protein